MYDSTSGLCFRLSLKIYKQFVNIPNIQAKASAKEAWVRQGSPSGKTDEEICILMSQVLGEV